MATRLVATGISGLDPNTGEVMFDFQEVDDTSRTAEPTKRRAAVEEFSGGDLETAMMRYRAVQGWATKVQQKNLALEQKMAELEERVMNLPRPNTKPAVRLPNTQDPGIPNLENVLSDPVAFHQFIVNAVQSQLGLVGEYVQQQMEPFLPVLAAYNTHNELQTAVARHPDFIRWQPEMLKVSQGLAPDKEMTLEQLYHEARKQNPQKAMALDTGESWPDEFAPAPAPAEEEKHVMSPAAASVRTTAPGTDPRDPGTQLQFPAVAPSAVPRMPTATADELKQLAAQHITETGIADGSSPVRTALGIDAAMDAAWAETVLNQ